MSADDTPPVPSTLERALDDDRLTMLEVAAGASALAYGIDYIDGRSRGDDDALLDRGVLLTVLALEVLDIRPTASGVIITRIPPELVEAIQEPPVIAAHLADAIRAARETAQDARSGAESAEGANGAHEVLAAPADPKTALENVLPLFDRRERRPYRPE